MLTIKRYANRKLYDTGAKQYITLAGIADLMREGAEVRVIDHETGDDLTAVITAQIIFAQEKRTGGLMPRAVLQGLLQAGNDTLAHLRQSLSPYWDGPTQIELEIERRVQALVTGGELSAEEGASLLAKLLAQGRHSREPSAISLSDLRRALEKRGLPSRAALNQFAQQVEAIKTDLDQLRPKGTPQPR
jgi:polyhydroxyalkanoate synthesis repressor PhaR